MITFKPNYVISESIQGDLKRIETAKEKIQQRLSSLKTLDNLREPVQFVTVFPGAYSTTTVTHTHTRGHLEGPDASQNEQAKHNAKTYGIALKQIEAWAAKAAPIDENMIQTLHQLMMGSSPAKPTPYRTNQNYLKNNKTFEIVRTPPKAEEVSGLMSALIHWINGAKNVPAPIVAGIALFQLCLIHPFNDGNGRTGRLFATLILHSRGYGLQGLYNLEKAYCRDLRPLFQDKASSMSLSGAITDFTSGLDLFLGGLALTFEKTLANVALVSPKMAVV